MRLKRCKFWIATRESVKYKSRLEKVLKLPDNHLKEGFTYCGNLIIEHRSKSNWIVTHKSGLRIFTVSNKEKAKNCLKEMMNICTWEEYTVEQLNCDDNVKQQVKTIRSKYNGY